VIFAQNLQHLNTEENILPNNLSQSFAILLSFFAFTFYTGCGSTETTDGTVSVSFSTSNFT
jgi:hypothetical protein